MSLKRMALYGTYKTLRTLGYIQAKNKLKQFASVLMYHRVNENINEQLSVNVTEFDKMMEVFSKHYRVISLYELLDGITRGETFDSRTVVITFDDGYKDNYQYAAPILKKYNLPATFFVTSSYIDTQRIFDWDKGYDTDYPLMTWDDVRELDKLGFDIGSHTMNHVDLGTVSLEEARAEIYGSKEKIEQEIGRKIDLFAFPFGRKECIRPEVIDIVKDAGFMCCCSGYGGKVTKSTDLFNVCRVGAAYPNTLELLMEVDNFMTYYDGDMNINIFTTALQTM